MEEMKYFIIILLSDKCLRVILVFRFLFVFILLALNLIFLSTVAIILELFILAFPRIRISILFTKWVSCLVALHAKNIRYVLERFSGVEFDFKLPDNFSVDESSIVIVNHQSHVDILIFTASFFDKIPQIKFFLKRSLQYVPFLGWFCYILDYPFIDKISRKAIKKDKDLAYRQRVALHKQCQRILKNKVSLVIFAEGTRFKEEKKSKEFEHVLSPEPMGLALACMATQGKLKKILDVTIIYSGGKISVWSLLSGGVKKVQIHGKIRPVFADNKNVDYWEDRTYRRGFTQWLQNIWKEKDRLISQCLAKL